MLRRLPPLLAFAALACPASGQGVPTFDAQGFARTAALIAQRDRDLALQRDRLTREEELAEIERQQLAALNDLVEATSSGGTDVSATIQPRHVCSATLARGSRS